MEITVSRLLILVSVIVFVFAACGGTVGSFGELDLIAVAAAFFATAHLT